MPKVKVVGLGMGPMHLSPQAREAVEWADTLAGGSRMLGWFPDHPGERLPLTGGLEAWLDQVADLAAGHRVTVLASGDPGFYGIADKVIRRLGGEQVEVIPNVSTVQAAMAKLGLPWQEAKVVSLHGRDMEALFAALPHHDLLAVYTDPDNSPDQIAREMLGRGQTNWTGHVLEDLGDPKERVRGFSLPEMAATGFSKLNLLVLQGTGEARPLHLGMADEAFEHQNGLITKSEVRAVALAKLRLLPNHILWDLGAGSGSVGLEASRLLWQGRVLAFEKRQARVEQIKANQAKFGAANLEVVQAELPLGLAGRPRPDRVFIGGGGSELEEIISAALKALKPGGVLVVSAVRLEAVYTALETMSHAGPEPELVQVQVSRGSSLAGGTHLKAQNPVFLISTQKECLDEK